MTRRLLSGSIVNDDNSSKKQKISDTIQHDDAMDMEPSCSGRRLAGRAEWPILEDNPHAVENQALYDVLPTNEDITDANDLCPGGDVLQGNLEGLLHVSWSRYYLFFY